MRRCFGMVRPLGWDNFALLCLIVQSTTSFDSGYTSFKKSAGIARSYPKGRWQSTPALARSSPSAAFKIYNSLRERVRCRDSDEGDIGTSVSDESKSANLQSLGDSTDEREEASITPMSGDGASVNGGVAAAAAAATTAATTVAVAAKVAGVVAGRGVRGAAVAAAAGAMVAGAASVVDATRKNGTIAGYDSVVGLEESAQQNDVALMGQILQDEMDEMQPRETMSDGEFVEDSSLSNEMGEPAADDDESYFQGKDLQELNIDSTSTPGDGSTKGVAAAAAAAATTVVVAAKVAGVVSGAAVVAAAGAAAAGAAGANLKNSTREYSGLESVDRISDQGEEPSPDNIDIQNVGSDDHQVPVVVEDDEFAIIADESTIRPFVGLRGDILRRLPSYKSDWTDGFQPKTVSAVLLLYVACLAPTVSFGGLSAVLTDGNIGVVEFLVSHGVSGIIYSIISGQPMTFIAPTGLTLAFMAALYRFAGLAALPFLPLYGWVGIWTAGMLTILSLGGLAQLIEFCTSFTDDVFNALLALNFVVEACKSLAHGFIASGPDKTSPFLSLNFAVLTCYASLRLNAARTSKLFNKDIREAISDFGPILVILLTSVLSLLPVFKSLGMEFLQVPEVRQLAGGRRLFLPLGVVPVWARWAAAFPAVLLTLLFYLDHLISVRVVNAPRHRIKKGTAYNQDLLALGSIVALQSVCGMPWMCGATVQSLNHIRAMATYADTSEVRALEMDEHETSTDPGPSDLGVGRSEGELKGSAVSRMAMKSAQLGIDDSDRSIVRSTDTSSRDAFEEQNDGWWKTDQTDGVAGTAVSEAARDKRLLRDRRRLALKRLGRAIRRTGEAFLGVSTGDIDGYDSDDDVNAIPVASAPAANDEKQLQIVSVVETRLSGLVLHSMILSSVLLLPFLKFIPMPVIYGIFLYLGRKVSFFRKTCLIFPPIVLFFSLT